jgi:hypothetical protein
MEIFEEIDYAMRMQTEILLGIKELLRGQPYPVVQDSDYSG